MKGEDITYEYMRKQHNRELSKVAEKHVEASKLVKRGEKSRDNKGPQTIDLESQKSLPTANLNASPQISNEIIYMSNDRIIQNLSPPYLNSQNMKVESPAGRQSHIPMIILSQKKESHEK